MKTPDAAPLLRRPDKMKRPRLQILDRRRTPPRPLRVALRALTLLLAVALCVAGAFYVSSSASSPYKFLKAKLSATTSTPVSRTSLREKGDAGKRARATMETTSVARPSLLTRALLFQIPLVETIDTYKADCATPETVFNLGDTVCAKVTNAPSGSPTGRVFNWADPNGFVASATPITASTQTNLFTLPATATSIIDGLTVNNRGTWRIGSIATSDGASRSAAYITVRDPITPTVDLVIYNFDGNSGDALVAGTDTSFILWATNNGPDAAQNVHITQTLPANMTFVSATQETGPTFTCAENAGAINCSIATFAKDAKATFTLVYHVDVTTPNALISSTAEISSNTTELHSADNIAGARVKIAADPGNVTPPTCTLSCPSDITQTNDPAQAGAIVNYSSPSTLGDSCEPVNCDVPSGSFFPIGTTPVTCTASTGASCSFNVTVQDTRSLTITLNGADSMMVECHAGFTDPGATARDGAGGSVAVTTSGTVDANTPGAYTLTYTASDGGNTATATRTVTVVDSTPPTVTLNGDETMTVECHASFTDPGATASDDCAGGNIAVTVSGSVDVNTPGTYVLTYTAGDGTKESSVTRTVTVVDTTPPTINLVGANPLTVECHAVFTDPGASASDACAGALPVNASGSVDANTPGAYTITYTATDGTHTVNATRTVNVVDTTPPAITLNGPSSINVECHTSFTDPGASASDGCAGVVSVTTSGSVNVNASGSYTLTYSATDASGNTATATRTVRVVDTTPPVISCPANIITTLPLNTTATSTPVNFNVTATDSCSGSANVTTTQASGSLFHVGTTIVTATATDAAGNSSSCSFTVTVLYNFAGFFQPISNLPVINTVNAGRAIPVKFSLSGDKGLNIFAAGYPASGLLACNSTDPAAEVTETVTAGGSSLNYSAGSDQYSYIWKTEGAWAGTCRQLVIKLNDGSLHRANFKFR